MKAFVCNRWGGPETLELGDVASPEPRAGEIVVTPKAWGVNFADLVLLSGQYHLRPPFPFTPGMEIAGEVLKIGPGVEGYRPGDRVGAYVESGGFAERVAVDVRAAVKLPDAMDDIVGSIFPTTYGTAYIALVDRAGLQKGEMLLVTGAGGSVGQAAVEIGKCLGATVTAAASDSPKLAAAERHGATHLINYTTENLPARVKEITGGRGADVIFDPVGGDAFDAAMRSVAFEGRVVVIGFASGRIPSASAGRILIKSCSVIGSSWTFSLYNRPERIARTLDTLVQWYENGALRPAIWRVMPFKEAPAALELVAKRKPAGKIVLTNE